MFSQTAVVSAEFVVCAAVILWSGVRLTRYGDVIAEKTGLGGTWVGLILLATVTSLPELVTGVSSVLLFDVPDIAAGDAIGSCMFNMLVLALLDVRDPIPLSARIHQGHVLSAAFGVVLLGLLTMAIVLGANAPAIGWVGVHSLLFLALYALGMRTIFVFERGRMAQIPPAAEPRHDAMTLRGAVTRYALAAAVLVTAASVLPGIAEQLAAVTGLGHSFVGTLFVAGTTSLPEIVVSVTAMRMGALDMAAANLFGSNLFNVAVIGVDDLLYTRGPMLASVSPVHLLASIGAIMMTAIAVIGLTFRAAHKRFRLSWDSVGIVGVYVAAVWLLIMAGG
jgi:cation:H+ antiporter